MKMKSYNVSPEFTLIRTSKIQTSDSNLAEFLHIRSGARIFFLDREDDNKTFAIGFKTPPTDDTGVFHILEHCVLAGSEKYPVKDPMTELMKGSLYTYLNAFTYPDKTVYPVSSKNDKAFLDLISVYMDAVLHPLALKNKSIFLSEGHRTDFDSDGRAVINGVVYNEMKGAYSSVDELTEQYISRLLYEGGSYSYDSGGRPSAIPSLTFDSFLLAHKRYYHPSNSVIFIDGSVDLDAVLSLIDSYLSEYEAEPTDAELTDGALNTSPLTEYYPSEDTEEKDRTRLTLAYRGFPHSDYLDSLAVTAVTDSIADSNSSPFKKSVLDSGLCENVHLYYSASNLTGALFVQFINVKDGCTDELISLFDKTMENILSSGIDRSSLEGVINLTEFKTREADFGSFPRGMIYMNAVMEYAILGENPALAFDYDSLFGALRERLGTGYYESSLKRILSGKRATLILMPKARGSDEPDPTDCKKTSPAELTELYRWIETPDTPEALAKIPSLTLSDIGEAKGLLPTRICESDGATVIEHTADTSGITYLDLYFDVSDIEEDMLPALRFITLIIGDCATEGGDAKCFKDRVKMNLGDLAVTLTPVMREDGARLYLTVRASALSTKTDILLSLMHELIYTARLDDAEMIKQKTDQLFAASEEALSSDALSVCIGRVGARYDTLSAMRERMYGYEFHRYLKKAKENVESIVKEISSLAERIREEFLKRGRLTISITRDKHIFEVSEILSRIKAGGAAPHPVKISLLPRVNEAIAIPGTVGYSAYGSNMITELKEKYCGSLGVLTSMLTYEHLWSEIRVKGGAYDTGIVTRGGSGGIIYYSYRDPSPKRSIKLFEDVKEAADEVIANAPLLKYIISTVGAIDTVSTPRSEAASENLLYLSGKPRNYSEKIRDEVIATDEGEIRRLSALLGSLRDTSTYCIAAPRSTLAGEEIILEI